MEYRDKSTALFGIWDDSNGRSLRRRVVFHPGFAVSTLPAKSIFVSANSFRCHSGSARRAEKHQNFNIHKTGCTPSITCNQRLGGTSGDNISTGESHTEVSNLTGQSQREKHPRLSHISYSDANGSQISSERNAVIRNDFNADRVENLGSLISNLREAVTIPSSNNPLSSDASTDERDSDLQHRTSSLLEALELEDAESYLNENLKTDHSTGMDHETIADNFESHWSLLEEDGVGSASNYAKVPESFDDENQEEGPGITPADDYFDDESLQDFAMLGVDQIAEGNYLSYLDSTGVPSNQDCAVSRSQRETTKIPRPLQDIHSSVRSRRNRSDSAKDVIGDSCSRIQGLDASESHLADETTQSSPSREGIPHIFELNQSSFKARQLLHRVKRGGLHSQSLASSLPYKPVDRVAHDMASEFRKTMNILENVPLRSSTNPRCERCGSPTDKLELERNGGELCSACYCKIHIARTSSSALGDQDPGKAYRSTEELAEVEELEARTTAAARLAAEGLVERRKSSQRRRISSRSENTQQKGMDIITARNAIPSCEQGKPSTIQAKMDSDSSQPARASGRNAQASAQVHGDAGRRDLDENSTASRLQGYGDDIMNRNGGHGKRREREWFVKASDRSLRTINPIRQLVQNIAGDPNPEKELIDLSVGDPTRYGNLQVDSDTVEKFCRILRDGMGNGYTQSMGSLEARQAVAARYSLAEIAPLTEKDVFLTAGVSGALELALGALANEGDNVLLPRPGFPLFKTILDCFGVEARYYNVLAERSWEVDLNDLPKLADHRTVAVVLNNPSNPCGSVFSAEHIADILHVAASLRLPIIADEVYADMVFSNHAFVSVASMAHDVPVLSVGGASKQFVVPGWRAGWLLVHDRHGILEAGGVRRGIAQLTTRMLMTNAPAQAILPHLLARGVHCSHFKGLMDTLERNAQYVINGLQDAVGIRCIVPQGSMYLMVQVDVEKLGFADDLEFAKTLRTEESVFVLPGQCFQAPNYVRIVFCAPKTILEEATKRICEFCARRAVVP